MKGGLLKIFLTITFQILFITLIVKPDRLYVDKYIYKHNSSFVEMTGGVDNKGIINAEYIQKQKADHLYVKNN